LSDEKHIHSHNNTTEHHTLRSYVSRAFRLGHGNAADVGGGDRASLEISHQVDSGSGSSASSSVSSVSSVSPMPMLDPSTNANPLSPSKDQNSEISHLVPGDRDKKRRKKHNTDVSKHTFYVENSQMRLKLFARNEVS